MQRWMTYIYEYFSFVFIAFVLGVSLSGIYVAESSFHLLPFILSFIGVVLSFALLYLMDHLKSLEKDKIAYPQRALSRGLIKKQEIVRVIELMQVILFAYSMVLWVFLQSTAALAFLGALVYLVLWYKEFGAGHWLRRHPILYGLSHQFTIVPIAVFAVAAAHPEAISMPATWSFALMLLGAFSCYEICQKLDPRAHPILATYIHFYGFRRTFEIAAAMLAFSAMGAIALDVAVILIPFEFILLGALSTLFFQPALFRIPQVVSTISLLAHAWAVAVSRLF